MKTFYYLLFVFSFSCLSTSCDKEKTVICEGCRKGTLYYTPYCGTQEGYIILDGEKTSRPFRNQLEMKYQKEKGIRVCVIYKSDAPDIVWTADCLSGDAINITCLQEDNLPSN